MFPQRPPSHDTGFVVVPANSGVSNVSSQPTAVVGTNQQTPQTSGSLASNTQDSAMTAQQLQRLKVEDALSYLDKVKIKYLYQPDIYNQFLDIMKEFKSQSIDTPGVIRRVSTLFQKDPDLIIGFNTFLPPGFRMEVKGETVVIKQPTGTTVLSSEELTAARQQLIGQQNSVSPPVYILQTTGTNQRPNIQTSTSNVPPAPNQEVTANQAQQNLQGSQQQQQQQPQQQQQTSQQAQGGQAAASINVPVEFNYAINYVNKIKLRFQDKPDVYKQFLEILHRYQKEQKMIREGAIPQGSRFLTEAEVYAEVSRLFTNQKDILDEFGHFLPETTAASGANLLLQPGGPDGQSGPTPGQFSNFPTLQAAAVSVVAEQKPLPISVEPVKDQQSRRKQKNGSSTVKVEEEPPQKKITSSKKIRPYISPHSDLAEAAKYGKLEEIEFFDKARKILKPRQVYDNFLRCVNMYAEELCSKSDLLNMIVPFFKPHPELLRQFKDMLGLAPSSVQKDATVTNSVPLYSPGGRWGQNPQVEVDYSTLKIIDESESYRMLPSNYPQQKCSGRTALCYEVLNDQYVSFPAWSESSYFVSAKKTQYEETIYRCEDERFELEMVIEINLSAIHCLEGVQRKLAKMSSEDAANYRLDNALGGTSEVIQQKAIQRLYGDRAPEIIEGLKRNPVVAVPIVLRRLRAKDEEWRDAQRAFNKIWREQMRKFYLRSLDHQGINFKQNDVKALRSKALLNEIEESFEAAQQDDRIASTEPHLLLQFDDCAVIDDATGLIVHHAKRQSGLTKDCKRTIKQLLYHFLPDMFHMKRHDFSDSEDESDTERDSTATDDEDKSKQAYVTNRQARAQARAQRMQSTKGSGGQSMETDQEPSQDSQPQSTTTNSGTAPQPMEVENGHKEADEPEVNNEKAEQEEPMKQEKQQHSVIRETQAAPTQKELSAPHLLPPEVDTRSSLFFGGNHWYLFIRLYSLLCNRLQILLNAGHKVAAATAVNEQSDNDPKNSAAIKLKYKSPPEYEPSQYYAVLLKLVRDFLDCSVDSLQYEEQLRQMFGTHAYLGFTLDKIVQLVVKQLQHLVQDESYHMVMQLFHDMIREGVAFGRIVDAAHRQMAELSYERRVCKMLSADNVFRFSAITGPANRVQFGIEMIASESSSTDSASALANWSSYVRFYANPELRLRMSFRRPRFLLRGWRKRAIPDDITEAAGDPEPVFECGTAWGQREAVNLAEDDPRRTQLMLWDNEHAIICPKTLRIQYTNDHRMVFFRKGRPVKHDEKQKKIVLAQNQRLHAFTLDWEKKNVTESLRNYTVQWFIDRMAEPIAAGSESEPPYHRYNRYKTPTSCSAQ